MKGWKFPFTILTISMSLSFLSVYYLITYLPYIVSIFKERPYIGAIAVVVLAIVLDVLGNLAGGKRNEHHTEDGK